MQDKVKELNHLADELTTKARDLVESLIISNHLFTTLNKNSSESQKRSQQINDDIQLVKDTLEKLDTTLTKNWDTIIAYFNAVKALYK